MSVPSLIRLDAQGSVAPLATSPFWIGSAPESALTIPVPSVADRHALLVEREDGWWVSPGRGRASVNGAPLTTAQRLRDGDRLDIAPGYAYRFAAASALVAAQPTSAPARPQLKRRRARAPRAPRQPMPIALMLTVVGIALLIAAAGTAIWYATHTERSASLLTDDQAARFDSLLVVADDHIERGSTLLELGLADVAGQEFARGVNTLALSDLRNHPAVKPRIEALEASIAAIYRDRRLVVPGAYAAARSSLSPDKLRAASLTPEQFAAAFQAVAAGFSQRFGSAIEVTGRDHAEHLSLYGPGGALDLRTRGLSEGQLAFVVGECRSRGIRVKDFSQDSVLRRQIETATRAGLLDRVSTGLHLHIDRFANRRDAFTVGG